MVSRVIPSTVLITRQFEIQYAAGQMSRHLSLRPGPPTADLLSLTTTAMRTLLQQAVDAAAEQSAAIAVDAGHVEGDGQDRRLTVDVQPVRYGDETLFLVSFIEREPAASAAAGRGAVEQAADISDVARELALTRAELRGVVQDLARNGVPRRTANDDAPHPAVEGQSETQALQVQEELRSPNEQLTTLNGQLQASFEKQRATADDLQNVLYSTDLATLFLDRTLRIRFFTPPTRLLFNVLPGDVGRRLSDLRSLADDAALEADAALVLSRLAPIEREIEAESGDWFVRRILPYRTHGGEIEGVVVTYTGITERKRVARDLESARQEADLANMAKSRFLAVASHELRQPMQALSLIQGLLARSVQGDTALGLVGRLDESLKAMSGMLNTLLDINQMDSGALNVAKAAFLVDEVLHRLLAELSYQAEAEGVVLTLVRSSLWVDSDPSLLEQMVRNLLANALKFMKRGRIVFGCRKRDGRVRIEVWDSGVGIGPDQLKSVFQPYHQIMNPTLERRAGLGLGLSIVARLAELLDHTVGVTSWPGRGSVFWIEADRPSSQPMRRPAQERSDGGDAIAGRSGLVLIVDDDEQVLELLSMALESDGHRVLATQHPAAALELLACGTERPDVLLVDFNMPGGVNGIEFVRRARATLGRSTPALVLTGDISAITLKDIADEQCLHVGKPVKPGELNAKILAALAPQQGPPAPPAATAAQSVVYVIDDDAGVRRTIAEVLRGEGLAVRVFGSAEAFLNVYEPGGDACLLVDAYLPGMGGLDLLHRLAADGDDLPTLVMTGHSDIAIAVQAIKAGASEFIEKPVDHAGLVDAVRRALATVKVAATTALGRADASARITSLTLRQKEIMDLVLAGQPSKNIAADLGISRRTVENHRALIMRKMGAASLPELARLALALS